MCVCARRHGIMWQQAHSTQEVCLKWEFRLGFPGPATGVIWASGPKVGKRVGKWVPGASRPQRPKSRKRSRKRVKIVEKQSILTLFRLRFGLFGPRGREAPGTHFPTLFPTLGPEGPNDPCSGPKFSQNFVFEYQQKASITQKNSRRLELSIQKTQRTEGGDKVQAVSTQGSRQVCLSRCPKFCSIARFGYFPAIFVGLSWSFPWEPPNRPRKHPQPSRAFWITLSGPLNRLNAILSLLHPLDSYRTPSAIGSAIGRPLSRPISHPNTGGSPQPPCSKPLGGLNRAIVVL